MATKYLYKINIEPKSAKQRVYDFLDALSCKPQHKWIPFVMIVHLDHMKVTPTQAEWIAMVAKRKLGAKVTFTKLERKAKER